MTHRVTKWQHLKELKRRRDLLVDRIATIEQRAPRGNHDHGVVALYERRECAAITWALEVIEGLDDIPNPSGRRRAINVRPIEAS